MLREDGAREYNRRHLAGKFVVAPAIGTSRFSVRYEPYDAAEDSVRFDSLRALTRALNYPAEWTNLCKIVVRNRLVFRSPFLSLLVPRATPGGGPPQKKKRKIDRPKNSRAHYPNSSHDSDASQGRACPV